MYFSPPYIHVFIECQPIRINGERTESFRFDCNVNGPYCNRRKRKYEMISNWIIESQNTWVKSVWLQCGMVLYGDCCISQCSYRNIDSFFDFVTPNLSFFAVMLAVALKFPSSIAFNILVVCVCVCAAIWLHSNIAIQFNQQNIVTATDVWWITVSLIFRSYTN